MMRIDEAERHAATAANRLRQGKDALDALKWLREHAGDADLHLTCHTASACNGFKQALAYLNTESGKVLATVIENAEREAQRDMDHYLGKL